VRIDLAAVVGCRDQKYGGPEGAGSLRDRLLAGSEQTVDGLPETISLSGLRLVKDALLAMFFNRELMQCPRVITDSSPRGEA